MKWKIGDVVALKSAKWDPMTVALVGSDAAAIFMKLCGRDHGESTVEVVRSPASGGYSVSSLGQAFFHEDMLVEYEEPVKDAPHPA